VDLQFTMSCSAMPQKSFEVLKFWIRELKNQGPSEIVIAIAGNKSGKNDSQETETERDRDKDRDRD
jgi:GTPase SAR1 family protein